MRLTKKYLRSVHSTAVAAAQSFREQGIPFLATILTPVRPPSDSSDLAVLIGKVKAISTLLDLNPSAETLATFKKLKELLRIEE